MLSAISENLLSRKFEDPDDFNRSVIRLTEECPIWHEELPIFPLILGRFDESHRKSQCDHRMDFGSGHSRHDEIGDDPDRLAGHRVCQLFSRPDELQQTMRTHKLQALEALDPDIPQKLGLMTGESYLHRVQSLIRRESRPYDPEELGLFLLTVDDFPISLEIPDLEKIIRNPLLHTDVKEGA